MTRRLRELWDRPIGEGGRRPLFIAVAALLVVLATASALVPGGEEKEEPERAPARDLPSPPVAEPRPADPALPDEERLEGVSAEGLRAARQTAERFLEGGYLAYSYGRLRAWRIPRATRRLRGELAAMPPRVQQAERGDAATLKTLQVEEATRRSARFLALVEDRRRTYTLGLSLAVSDGRWVVAEVAG